MRPSADVALAAEELTMVDLGRVAYEAYCGNTGWKSLVSGAALPQWDDLKPEIRAAWEVAAEAVKRCVAP